jgi:CBS domain-containing protein
MGKVVRDLMEHEVVTCSSNASLVEAARIMSEQNVSYLVVIDETDEACGLITEMDLLRSCSEKASSVTVEEIMTSPVPTISPTAPVAQAIATMLDKGQHHLVIVHNIPAQPLRPVGIISAGDIIREIAEEETL